MKIPPTDNMRTIFDIRDTLMDFDIKSAEEFSLAMQWVFSDLGLSMELPGCSRFELHAWTNGRVPPSTRWPSVLESLLRKINDHIQEVAGRKVEPIRPIEPEHPQIVRQSGNVAFVKFDK